MNANKSLVRYLYGEAGKDACYYKVKRRYRVFPSAYASGAIVKCRKMGAKNWGNAKKESVNEETLNKWFDRNRGKGWIDCKKSRKGHLVPCGRQEGEKRKGYPACRPTLSQCTSKGERAKKSSKRVDWD
jgi:hypothetical protein